MGNKVKKMFDFSSFEPVAEDSENKLVGGFSASVSRSQSQSQDTVSNNCLGANCASGCGNGQNANGAAGCGVKVN
ncbi:hypothetical protein [Ascidiimonas sp. W6]|uniref:hypothetical protein n=1 Tax=Ascidiimonas meishanensis TaxID=3128903 RepID=UPI0030EDA40C